MAQQNSKCLPPVLSRAHLFHLVLEIVAQLGLQLLAYAHVLNVFVQLIHNGVKLVLPLVARRDDTRNRPNDISIPERSRLRSTNFPNQMSISVSSSDQAEAKNIQRVRQTKPILTSIYQQDRLRAMDDFSIPTSTGFM